MPPAPGSHVKSAESAVGDATVSPSNGSPNDDGTIQDSGSNRRKLNEAVEKKKMEDQPACSTLGGWRAMAARGMDAFSNIVNENLLAARYGTFASIALLSAYGISKTPLFFRYKTVSEIPGSLFEARRTIYGRLIRIVENDGTGIAGTDEGGKPIICFVRQLSPAGRLLNRPAFDFFLKASPAAAVGKKLEDNSGELLKVEIAGIGSPPFYVAPSHLEQPGEWLRRLSKQRTPVACQLLARRAKMEVSHQNKRDATVALPELRDSIERGRVLADDQIAVCRLGYRPGFQLLRTDVATSLVRYGRATVSSSLYHPDDTRSTVDGSSRLEDLRSDASYLEKLGKAEYEAAKEHRGIWADSRVRADNKDTVEEANFQANAGIMQKLWRRIRG